MVSGMAVIEAAGAAVWWRPTPEASVVHVA